MTGILDGIRVLDFGRFIAGPCCGMLLADFGADVIRVDKRGGSEDRHIVPLQDSGVGGMFMQLNRNKRGLTLEPTTPEGREIVAKLVKQSDVVICNLPADALKAIGLDYDTLKAIKPDIILATCSTFGAEGPYAKKVGFDSIAQAMSGAMYMTGEEGKPYRAAAPYVDFGTALTLAFGTLLALMHRDKTGEGQRVEGTLLRTAMNFFNGPLIEQALTQINRRPTGNLGQTAAPSDVYGAKDGTLHVAVAGTPLYIRWAKLMGEPEWLDMDRFGTDMQRGEHGKLISARMQEWCSQRTVQQCLDELEANRIPAGPVLTPQQILDDPHVNETGMLQPVDFPGLAAPAPIMETPAKLSATPAELRHRAPIVGEHTDDILQEIGYDAAAIADLRAKEVV